MNLSLEFSLSSELFKVNRQLFKILGDEELEGMPNAV